MVECDLASLKSEHVKGQSNLETDRLLRKDLDLGEWNFNKEVFIQITHRVGNSVIDQLKSSSNCQVERFPLKFEVPKVEEEDTLSHSWTRDLLCTFPHVPLITRRLNKIRREGAEVNFVAPFWPR